MQCYTVNGTGLDSLRLEDRTLSDKPAAGEVLIDVHAVSLNYRDLMVADGRYSGKQEVPIIACSDMSGIVIEVGPQVTNLKAGDHVFNAPFRFWPAGQLQSHWVRTFVGGSGVDGVLAEKILYPAESLIRIPKHMNFLQASTLTIAGLTAWAAIITHGKAKAGDWILLHGTGGVSIFGAQIARIIGARTILTSSSPKKARLVKEKFGVIETVDYKNPDWPEHVKKITKGRGVDIVVDSVGGAMLQQSIKTCASGARIGLIGVLAGVESTISTLDIIMRQLTIKGILMESTEELRAFARACEATSLQPYIDRVFSFNKAEQAFDYLQSQKHIGKVVISIH